jgi:hypothetical protein
VKGILSNMKNSYPLLAPSPEPCSMSKEKPGRFLKMLYSDLMAKLLNG